MLHGIKNCGIRYKHIHCNAHDEYIVLLTSRRRLLKDEHNGISRYIRKEEGSIATEPGF